MDELISRKAAIDEIDKWIKAFRENGHKESAADARLIQDGIIQLPPAQPEIIRCKDCKWSDWYDSTDGNRYCHCMETGASGRTADDFCSYAEKENR